MFDYIAQQAINAIQIGAIYALIALGYSMVYGVLVMINFAHSDLFMLGAFAGLLLATMLPVQLPFVVILLLVMAVIGLLGAVIERVAYRPLRSAPRVSAIITALGCGLIIQNTALSLAPYPQDMPPLFTKYTFLFAGVSVTALQVLIIVVAIVLMVALDFFIRKTRYGMAMRAISFDARTVPLMGIPVNRVISATFLVGGGLGGAAGMLYAMAYSRFDPTLGMLIGWKAFVAAVIGGIGSVRGAVLGGFLIGAIEVGAVAFLNSRYQNLIAYSLLLLILIFKPYGLLGQPPNQKV